MQRAGSPTVVWFATKKNGLWQKIERGALQTQRFWMLVDHHKAFGITEAISGVICSIMGELKKISQRLELPIAKLWCYNCLVNEWVIATSVKKKDF